MIDDGRTRRDLVLFGTLTLLASWLPMLAARVAGPDIGHGLPLILYTVGSAGPTLVALGLWLAGRRRAPSGVRPWRHVGRWLPAALGLGAGPVLLGTIIAPLLGGPDPDWSTAGRFTAGVGGVGVLIVGLLVAGPLTEEFGWRGYAQPRLRRRLSPVATTLVLGSAWAGWHLPLFLLPGTSQHAMGLASPRAALFAVTLIGLSGLAWWVSEHRRGGVAAAVALHTGFNAAGALVGPDSLASTAIAAGLTVVAAVVALRAGSLRRDRHVPQAQEPVDHAERARRPREGTHDDVRPGHQEATGPDVDQRVISSASDQFRS